MDVEHIGHAGFLVSEGSFSLAIDPWFYPAFLESWFPWPDNQEHLSRALAADVVYITHAHEDHFDRRFLRGLNKDTLIIVPAFRSRYLEREVRKLGFPNVYVLQHGRCLSIGDASAVLTVTALLDQSHKEDSAVLVQDRKGFRFLDSNDCELALSDWPPDIDLLACQFSGAFWYPHCYDFTDEEKDVKAAAVCTSNVERLFRRVERTGARAYCPSAGPAVFLDEALMAFNYGSTIYPTFDQVLPVFREAFPGVALWPSVQAPMTKDAVANYQDRRWHEWNAFYKRDGTAASAREVDAHFTLLQRRNRRFLGSYARDILVSSDGQSWRIPLGLLRGELEEAPDPHYVLDVPPRVLRAILSDEATWETALLSNRISLRRSPDVYDTTLMGLLSFGDRPVQTLAMARQAESGETITRDGLTFQRWCPHAREDLTFATVVKGVIQCPRHGWAWDAVTGTCLTDGGLPLRVERTP